jgi:hypothetical protein
MMKKGFILFFLCLMSSFITAQQPLNRGGAMTYLVGPKPNNIIYHDTVFRGSKEFKHLFFRTGDAELLKLYDKHQANKVTGQILNFTGAIAIIVGISRMSGADKNTGLGWALIGGGFVSSAVSSYFTLTSQKNLVTAVVLFNKRYNSRASLGIGVGQQSTGLVYNF